MPLIPGTKASEVLTVSQPAEASLLCIDPPFSQAQRFKLCKINALRDSSWCVTQVFILLRCVSDNEYIDPKAGSFYLLTPWSCPCHWPCLVCPSHRSHTVHVTMWHCLYWDFSISFFLLRGIGGNGIQQRWCQAYSRLLNDLWYSPSHVLSMMFVLSNFHTWMWRLCRERDALSSLPRSRVRVPHR